MVSKAYRFKQILDCLMKADRPVAPYEIGRELLLSEMYVFNLLKELEQMGIVKRERIRHPVTRGMRTVYSLAKGRDEVEMFISKLFEDSD